MKKIIALLVIFSSFSFAQQTETFVNKLEQAKKEHKKILLYFSGSDWCAPCIKFKKFIIQIEEFQAFAKKEGNISDIDWVNGMKGFFNHLICEGRMESYGITRCKMGFRSIADMPEWMILMEFKDMGQMDSAFKRVVPQQGELETKHRSFNQFVASDIQHALFRDWPDDLQN